MKKDILCRPFAPDQVKEREGQGGKMLSYVETHSVIARLNEGCEEWSFEIVDRQILAEEVVVVGKLTADGIVKMAFGGASITRDRAGNVVSIADALKAAASDAIKKAASLLGVALELYGGPGANQQSPSRAAAAPPSASHNDRLTGGQLSAIQSIARKRNLDRGHLTSLLRDRFNKAEIGHLSRREASSFLSELTAANGAG